MPQGNAPPGKVLSLSRARARIWANFPGAYSSSLVNKSSMIESIALQDLPFSACRSAQLWDLQENLPADKPKVSSISKVSCSIHGLFVLTKSSLHTDVVIGQQRPASERGNSCQYIKDAISVDIPIYFRL